MSGDEPIGIEGVAGLSLLEDGSRRRLYGYVCEQRGPVSRDRAAAATGIGRTLAAYHLDKLVGAGLLVTSYQRPGERTGAGAGRPAKLYTRAERELSVSVPPRDYELLARLLAEATTSGRDGGEGSAVCGTARETGRREGREAGGDLVSALRRSGYQPDVVEHGDIELRNCPFHALARDHRDLVCGLNLCRVEGLLEGGGHRRARAVLAPAPGRCCVVVRAGGGAEGPAAAGEDDGAGAEGT